MRLPLAILIAVGACVSVSGCRSDSHRVEAELRKRETDVRELREDLDRYDAYNRALQFELRGMRGEPIGPVTPDGPVPSFPVRSLTLGRQTGGREVEGCTGDGAIQVVIEPRDAEGQSIKIPNAAAVVQVVEIAPDGLKRPLSVWEIPAEQLRNHWRAGLLTTGYVLVLPWKEPPTTEKLRVVVMLRLLDGRAFEAEKDVTIRLPPGTKRRIMPPSSPAAVDGPVLPAPRVLDSSTPSAVIGKPTPQLVSKKSWWEVGVTKPTDPAALIGRPKPLP